MVAGLAYSNSWPIKPCNGCRAGLFKQGNGCWAGLSNLAMVVGLAYLNKAMVVRLAYSNGWPIKPSNGCWAGLFKRMAYQTLQWLLGRPIQIAGLSNFAVAVGLAFQRRQWLLGWSIKPCNGCWSGLLKQETIAGLPAYQNRQNCCWVSLSNIAVVSGLSYKKRQLLLGLYIRNATTKA